MRNTVVIDLNVLVRALLTSGVDRIIYDAIKEERITLALCPDMFRNLAEMLIRPHLKLQLKDIKSLEDAVDKPLRANNLQNKSANFTK